VGKAGIPERGGGGREGGSTGGVERAPIRTVGSKSRPEGNGAGGLNRRGVEGSAPEREDAQRHHERDHENGDKEKRLVCRTTTGNAILADHPRSTPRHHHKKKMNGVHL